MTLIDDIARMEAAAKSHFVKPVKVEEPTREPSTDKITYVVYLIFILRDTIHGCST